MARLTKLAGALGGYLNQTPPSPLPSANSLRANISLGLFALELRRLGKKDFLELTRILTMNVADLGQDFFESDLVKGLLAFDATLGLFLGPRSPNTVFSLLYRLAGFGKHGMGGLHLPMGGMGALSDALAAAAMRAGAVIRTSAPVERILVEKESAVGVVLAGGEEIRAPVIASSADPQRTLLKLLEPGLLDVQFAKRIRHLRMNGCVAKLHLALDGLPESWVGAAGRIVLAPASDHVERAFDGAKYGGVSEKPALEVVIPTLVDPSLAPPGKHVASILAQYAPYRLRETTNAEARSQILERSLDLLAQGAPDLRRRLIAAEALTPQDLEAQYGLTGGQWHHGEVTLDQMFFLRPAPRYQQYRMPVPGLWLCGAGAHPGGNVSGLPGANAAREILKQVKSGTKGRRMTHVQHLTPFLRKTPFHAPIEQLMHGQGWVRWMGFQSPAFFDSEQSEYFAIRNGASVYDVSPLIKYSIRGRDAARFVDFLVTRDMTKVKPMQVAYTAWCDDDGRMIEEGTVFRLGESDFILNAALHQLHWLTEAAYGFDVAIEEVSDRFCGLALQGPTSRDILRRLGRDRASRPCPISGFSRPRSTAIGCASIAPASPAIWAMSSGSSLQDALWLWETLFRLGEAHKIAPIGSRALDMARIEAGFILVDVDYIGALHAIRPSQRQSPIEAGIGWAVGLKKQSYFVGKRALIREKAEGRSRHILVGLEIEGRKPAPGAFLYADKQARTEIGLTTSALWSPSLKKNIAFARVQPDFIQPGRQMWIEIWYPKESKIERSMVRCWARNRMFFDPPRKKT